jgi:hypothetical protein
VQAQYPQCRSHERDRDARSETACPVVGLPPTVLPPRAVIQPSLVPVGAGMTGFGPAQGGLVAMGSDSCAAGMKTATPANSARTFKLPQKHVSQRIAAVCSCCLSVVTSFCFFVNRIHASRTMVVCVTGRAQAAKPSNNEHQLKCCYYVLW